MSHNNWEDLCLKRLSLCWNRHQVPLSSSSICFQGASLDDTVAHDFRHMVLTPMTILTAVQYGLIGLGGVLLLIMIFGAVMQAARNKGSDEVRADYSWNLLWHGQISPRGSNYLIISPVSEGSGDVMVLRQSRPPPVARHPPPAARNGVNAITQKPWDGLFSNLVYTLVVIVSWPD